MFPLRRQQTVRQMAHAGDETWSPLEGLPRHISPRLRWIRGLALGVMVGLLLAGLNARASFGSIETASQAYRLSIRAQLAAFHAPIGPIVIVAIDNYTCAPDWHGCPPPRGDTAQLIDKLRTAQVRLIALDQLFLTNRPGSDQLAVAMRHAANVVVVGQFVRACTPLVCTEDVQLPIDAIARAAKDSGLANYACTAAPRLVRDFELGCAYDGQYYPGLALSLYRLLDASLADRWNGKTIRLNYAGSPAGTYPQLSYRTLIESPQCVDHGVRTQCPGVVGADIWDGLRDKVVFVGRTDTLGNTDLFENPLAGTEALPGVELQATALNTLINDDPLWQLPAVLSFLLIFSLAIALAAIATTFNLTLGLVLGLIGLVSYYVLAFIALIADNLELPLVAPEITIAASFLLVLGARFALEERDQRRTRLLFSRFVPLSVVDDLVQNSDRVSLGTRSPIAVLFTDIRNFTALSEQVPPEVVMGALRTYFTEMVAIVLDHNGTVDKYIGDGLMALFGAPVPLTNPCLAAFQTALAMQAALPTVNARLARPLGATIRIGVGIHYGDAVFGLAGAPSKLEFTAIGDTVNIADRLESLCRNKGCDIVVSDTVYAHLSSSLQQTLLDIGTVSVKGRQFDIHVYGLPTMP